MVKQGSPVRSKTGDGRVTVLHLDDSADDRLLVKEAIALPGALFDYQEADGMESVVSYFQSHNGKPWRSRVPALVLVPLIQFTSNAVNANPLLGPGWSKGWGPPLNSATLVRSNCGLKVIPALDLARSAAGATR